MITLNDLTHGQDVDMTSLRALAEIAAQEQHNRDSVRIADDLRRRLLSIFPMLAPEAITFGQYSRPGRSTTYAQVQDFQFVIMPEQTHWFPFATLIDQHHGGDPLLKSKEQPPIALFRICRCGQGEIAGPIRSITDLGLMLENPGWLSASCTHKEEPDPVFECQVEVTEVAEDADTIRIGLTTSDKEDDAAWEPPLGTSYRMVLYPVAETA